MREYTRKSLIELQQVISRALGLTSEKSNMPVNSSNWWNNEFPIGDHAWFGFMKKVVSDWENSAIRREQLHIILHLEEQFLNLAAEDVTLDDEENIKATVAMINMNNLDPTSKIAQHLSNLNTKITQLKREDKEK